MTHRIPTLFACLLALGMIDSVSAQEDDFEKLAGGNIGRLESDDADPEAEVDNQLGEIGPIVFTASFDRPGEATFALYTESGQLLRILGQAIPVEAREYRVRWDGLDLFGNLVPAGTPVTFTVFHHPGFRVTYEMAVAPPNPVAPWPGTFETPEGVREGGWLGDHSHPSGAAALGDTVFLSFSLAEEGDNLIAVNAKGEKLWGHKLEGWDGPSLLNAGGGAVAALNRKRDKVYRVDPEPVLDKNGRRRIRQTEVLKVPRLEQVTVHGDDLLAIGLNGGVEADLPHPRAFGNRTIDFVRSLPQVLNTTPPSDFHISPQQAFGNLFTEGGSPQVGVNMIPHQGAALVMVVLKEPVQVGTVLIPALGGDVDRVEVLTLKEGTAYHERMSPLAGTGGDDIMSLTLDAQGEEWVPFASSALDAHVNWITSRRGPVKTQAVLIKAYPKGKEGAGWSPRLPMARILKPRIEPNAVTASDIESPTRLKQWNPAFGGALGWRAVTEYPISATYPLEVVRTYEKPVTFNMVMALDAVSPELYVDVRAPGESEWRELGRMSRRSTKKLRNLTASRHFFDRYLQLREPVTASAVRFRVHEGYKQGKWGENQDVPDLGEVEYVQLALAERGTESETPVDTHRLYWVDFRTGELQGEWVSSDYGVSALDFAPDGTLYSVAGGRLARTDWDRDSGDFRHEWLSGPEFDPEARLFMDVDADRIAVADRANDTVRIFDRSGRPLRRLGTGSGRVPGEWDPRVLENPVGVALASTGEIWVAEGAFAPKRISRFAADGNFVAEHLGPTMYGGGGRMDPDMKHFFYRGMEFHLDLERGGSRLARLYDQPYAENTPDAGAYTFGGIGYTDPVYHDGRRYLYGNRIIARKPDDASAAIPAVVFGYASNHPFLTRHEVWNKHWLKLNLDGKLFVWCDHNGDGAYQVEEVELGDADALPKLQGGTMGPGLSLWGKTYRWAPREFTPQGVPVYKLADLRPFDVDELAPVYHRNYTVSGPTSAKPGYGGFMYVSGDGYMAREGQPFVVKPDGTLLGGEPPKPSEYIPTIPGQVVQTAWSWAGGATTGSEVGEIAVINSFKGAWHVWGVKQGVLLGRFFTGEEGTFNGLEPERGMDVTRRYMGWEGWHADFLRAENGNYYAQGGKSFHSINRVHGLDDIRVESSTHTVPADRQRLAAELRPVLVARASASQGNRLAAYRQDVRLNRSFTLDGLIEDWGDRGQFTFLDEQERTTRFDASFNDQGLLIAIDGRGSVEGSVDDWREAVSEGFAIDLHIREAGRSRQRSRDVQPGDRRILLVKLDGAWRGILLRPKRGEGGGAAAPGLTIPSPHLDLVFEEARLLKPEELRVEVREKSLDVDLMDLGGGGGGFDIGGDLMLESEKTGGETKRGDGDDWTAEILLPWTLIGPGIGERRFDIGIREAGDGRHFYWNNAYPGPEHDPALRAHFNPGAWGWLELMNKRE